MSMDVQSLVGALEGVSLYKNMIFIISTVCLFLILTTIVFVFLKKRNWLTNKKYVIIYIFITAIVTIVFVPLILKFIGFKIGFYNVLSIVFFVVVFGILRYLKWKHFLVSFYENPKEHIYHKKDWVWILILGLCISLLFLYAYFFIIP